MHYPIPDAAQQAAPVSDEAQEAIASKQPERQQFALDRLRESLPNSFDDDYIQHVIGSFLVTSVYQGEPLSLPMIDLALGKEDALPYFFWGALYDEWKPNKEADGLSVFIQGYENRGEHNRRKKIYMSALTPDLYQPIYREKITQFFDQLFVEKNAGQPVMRHYLDNYFNLFWNLHLGVSPEAIPPEGRQVGQSFNTILAYVDPTLEIFYDNFMRVRSQRSALKSWIDQSIDAVSQGTIENPEKTFVYYWLKNGEKSENFRRKDVVFECFHNFVALSQWGNTIYNFMAKLSKNAGDSTVQAWFEKTMKGDYDQADSDSPFTPLDRFVMELFRTISPNMGSISTIQETREPRYNRYGYMTTPHKATSFDPQHWQNPTEFDPDRYKAAATSDRMDEGKSKQIGFAQCPFHPETFPVKDGRNTEMTNSIFGTVYNTTDDQAYPVYDYAGYAPFGFGYRRCAGELFTVEVFKDFFRKVWNDKIEFETLDLASPEKLPVAPTTIIDDNIVFTQ
jgi:cytochrome P450